MTLTVDAAQRQSIVPLQQSASSRLAGAFGPRFVTGSLFDSVLFNKKNRMIFFTMRFYILRFFKKNYILFGIVVVVPAVIVEGEYV